MKRADPTFDRPGDFGNEPGGLLANSGLQQTPPSRSLGRRS